MPNYDGLTPSEIYMTREIEILKSELNYYKTLAESSDVALISESPNVMLVDYINHNLTLAIKGQVKQTENQGYHIYCKDYRSGYQMSYHVSNEVLTTSRYKVAEVFQHIIKEITLSLAKDCAEGKV